MGAEAGGVAFIAHVADEEVLFRVLEVEAGFKLSILHHTGVEAAADEDDAGVLFERDDFGGGGDDGGGEKAEGEWDEGELHEGERWKLVLCSVEDNYLENWRRRWLKESTTQSAPLAS